jgi:hypothetical protein
MKAYRFITVLTCLGLVASCAHGPSFARIDGRVLDRDGHPLAGASIDLYTELERMREHTFRPTPATVQARTDSLGRFSLNCPKGPYVMYVAARYAGVVGMRHPQIVVSRDIRNLTLRFEGTKLSGHVHGANGREVQEVIARAIGIGPQGRLSGPEAMYSGASPYRLLIPPGSYRLVVAGQDDPTFATLDTLVMVSSQDDSLNVVAIGYAVTVRVTTNGGIPPSNFDVHWLNATGESYGRSRTDSLGRATMRVRPGRYPIVITPPHEVMAPWYLEATVQSDTVLIYALAPVRWRGTVRSRSTKTPLGAYFLLYQPSGQWWTRGRVQCDSMGRFEALVRPGLTYQAHGYMRGYKERRFALALEADSTCDIFLDSEPPEPAASGVPVPPTGIEGW